MAQKIALNQDRGLNEIIQCVPFTNDHLTDARLFSHKSVFHQDTTQPAQPSSKTMYDHLNLTKRPHSMFMILVSTTLLRPTSYQNVYKDIICIEHDNSEMELFNDVVVTTLAYMA